MNEKVSSVPEFIARHPAKTQTVIRKIRQIVKSVAPHAEEKISYGMPAYKVDGKILIYFNAYETHIGVYPGRLNSEAFNKTLKKYQSGKSTLKFSLDEPMPYDVIKKIVQLRLKETK